MQLGFVFCEILNFINVIIQIDLTDRFVNRALSTYGISNVWKYVDSDPLYRTDPMAITFPKVTKCVFQMFGPSGSIVKFDNICILYLNVYNERVYPAIW